MVAGGCYRVHERDVGGVDSGVPDAHLDAVVDARVADARVADARVRDAGSPMLVWVVVHPSDAPSGAGMYLFDESAQEVLRQLPLPDGVTSPHAILWDGSSLWLGGHDRVPAIREIDPETGAVRSLWAGVVTEGVATDGESYFYVADAISPLLRVDRAGTVLSSIALPEGTIQDLVWARGALYYLVNDGPDRIVRLDPETGAREDVARTGLGAPYSLGFDGTFVVVAMNGRAYRFDPETGELVSDSDFAVPGWITAISYVR